MIPLLERPVTQELIYEYFKPRELLPRKEKIYIVESGIVCVSTQCEKGSEIIIRYFGKSDYVFGLRQWDKFYVCMSNVVLRQVHEGIDTQELIKQIQEIEEQVAIGHIRDLTERTQAFLKWYSFKFGQDTEIGRSIPKISHRAIASSIHTTRVSITRMLKTLLAEGILERHNRCLYYKQ